MKFDWSHHSDGNVKCHISQEGYTAAIVDEMGLSSANNSPQMTPFRSGLPIDSFPEVDMSPEARAPLIAKMQSWLSMINWLQMCTCPDLATIFSLLSTFMHIPSPGHIDLIYEFDLYHFFLIDISIHFFSRNADNFSINEKKNCILKSDCVIKFLNQVI